MNEVTISKGRLIVIYAVIVVLLILVIILYLRAPPTQPPIYGEFLEHLKKDNVRIVTLISDQGEVAVFDKNLSLLPPCGKSQKDVPAKCKESFRPSNFNQLNAVTITVAGASPEESTVLIRTGDPIREAGLPPHSCPDGRIPPC
jgi:hypothetical protein